jgi:hypothetical protein
MNKLPSKEKEQFILHLIKSCGNYEYRRNKTDNGNKSKERNTLAL